MIQSNQFRILFVVLGFFLVWYLFGPDDAEGVIGALQATFAKYGILTTFIAAFVEGIVLVNLYFPGSIVVVAAILAVRGDPFQASIVVGTASTGFFLAALLNYYIGYLTFRPFLTRIRGNAWVKRVESWQRRWGPVVIPLCFIHPNLGAFVSVAAGRSHMNITLFSILGLFAIFGWNAIWGLLCYNYADTITKAATNGAAILLFLASWSAVSFIKSWYHK